MEGKSLEHPATRQHVADARCLDAVIDQLLGKRVVEIHADAAIHRHSRVGDHPRHRRWQEYSNVCLIIGQNSPSQESSQGQDADEQLSASQLDTRRVCQFSSPEKAPRGP